MTPEQFTIDQLRKDKIIYATESMAFNAFCLLTYISFDYIESALFPFLKGYIKPLSVLTSLGYTLYMGIGNLVRLQKIQKLESLLAARK